MIDREIGGRGGGKAFKKINFLGKLQRNLSHSLLKREIFLFFIFYFIPI